MLLAGIRASLRTGAGFSRRIVPAENTREGICAAILLLPFLRQQAAALSAKLFTPFVLRATCFALYGHASLRVHNREDVIGYTG
ncbi:MAG: hypothetical protein KDJ90_16345 [Nitratireductor sp.]|nr:hypothetical protein [Nitratireductor sp.]